MAYTTIDDPSEYFHTQLYTGTGSTNSITNDANAGDFKPDWVWVKTRNATRNHNTYDSSRGVRKIFEVNENNRRKLWYVQDIQVLIQTDLL